VFCRDLEAFFVVKIGGGGGLEAIISDGFGRLRSVRYAKGSPVRTDYCD
jgi:hypothetical protein